MPPDKGSQKTSALLLGLVLLLTFNTRLCSCSKSQEILPTKVLESEDTKVMVYDGIYSKKMLEVMSELLSRYAPWDFTYPEPEVVEENPGTDNGNHHFVAAFSPEDFTKSKIWRLLKKKIPDVFSKRKYLPYDVQGVLINRGDFPNIQTGKNTGDLFIRIFLTEKFKKNDYSELVFYNKQEEIFAAVHQRLGRAVIWNDTTDFIFKPPSMNHHGGEKSIFIKATEDREKFKEAVAKHKIKAEERGRMAQEPFPLTNVTDDSIYKIDLSKHVTREFHDSHNRSITVFDDVVPKKILNALRSYFFKFDSSYVYNPHDPQHGEETDNVNWVAQVKAEALPLSLVWQYIHHIASYLSGETGWHPYDVAMNIIQHIHHPRIHADCEAHEHEYTFLMYLTPDWAAHRYGETIFFEETEKSKKNKKSRNYRPGDEKYETLTAVVPKFGRIVMFRNIIDHSARPPSPDFLAARYTFAVKVGRNPQIAIGKKLRELLGDFDDEDKKRLRLFDDLFEGKYAKGTNKRGFLEKKYSYYLKKRNINEKENKNYYYRMLSLIS